MQDKATKPLNEESVNALPVSTTPSIVTLPRTKNSKIATSARNSLHESRSQNSSHKHYEHGLHNADSKSTDNSKRQRKQTKVELDMISELEISREAIEHSRGSSNESDSLLVRSEMYSSIVAAFEKNRNQNKDVSAALIVVLNKHAQEGPQGKQEIPECIYHHVELTEKVRSPDRPSTPLWKTFRWKDWAIKKGLISNDPIGSIESGLSPEAENLTLLHDKKFTNGISDSGGTAESEVKTSGTSGEEMEYYYEPVEERSKLSSNSPESGYPTTTEGREGTNESEEHGESNEPNYLILTNSEGGIEDEEEGEFTDEDFNEEETPEHNTVVECVSSEMYEALKKSFEANIGNDASAALIIVKTLPTTVLNKAEDNSMYLCHPVVLTEVKPDRPPTPLWKTFRWKAWAIKKGLIPNPEDVVSNKSAEDSVVITPDLILNMRENESGSTNEEYLGEVDVWNEEAFNIENTEDLDEDGQRNTSATTAGSEKAMRGSEDTFGSEGSENESEGEDDYEINSLRSTESLTVIQKKRDRLAVENEKAAALKKAEEDTILLNTILEKLKKIDFKRYCERRSLIQEEKAKQDKELLICSSTDSNFSKCTFSSVDSILAKSSESSGKQTNSSVLANSPTETEDLEENGSPNDEDLGLENEEEMELVNQGMEPQVEPEVHHDLWKSLSQLKKTEKLSMENSITKRNSLTLQPLSANEQNYSDENETENEDKSVALLVKETLGFTDMTSDNHKNLLSPTFKSVSSANITEKKLFSPKISNSANQLGYPMNSKVVNSNTSVHHNAILSKTNERNSTNAAIERIPSKTIVSKHIDKELHENRVKEGIQYIEENSPDFNFSLSDYTKGTLQQNLEKFYNLPNQSDPKVNAEKRPATGIQTGVHSIPERLKKFRLLSSDSRITINSSGGGLCGSKEKGSPTRFSNFGSRNPSSAAKLAGKSFSDIIHKTFLNRGKINKPVPLIDGSSIAALVKGDPNPFTCTPILSESSTECSVVLSPINETLEQQDVQQETLLSAQSDEDLENNIKEDIVDVDKGKEDMVDKGKDKEDMVDKGKDKEDIVDKSKVKEDEDDSKNDEGSSYTKTTESEKSSGNSNKLRKSIDDSSLEQNNLEEEE